MPVYLLHGFKWARPAIRIHVIVNKIDDAAPEWLISPRSTQALQDNFHHVYPKIMTYLPQVHFIEQYDQNDLSSNSQPYAYVADIVHEIKLGADIDELRAGRIPYSQWDALMQLRDQLAADQKIAWYVVHCSDLERSYEPPSTRSSEEAQSRLSNTWTGDGASRQSMTSYSTGEKPSKDNFKEQRTRRSSISQSIKKVFGGGGGLKKSKSIRSLRSLRKNDEGMRSFASGRSQSPPPPMPFQMPAQIGMPPGSAY